MNVFVKPDEQSDACISYAMARKGRMKSNILFNKYSFVNLACILRVCCVYVDSRIVYVSVPLVYVETDRFPFVYRGFRDFSCTLERIL